ncbi:MAG: glycine cleavage system aminomethyltransferase GcvT [Deltaproteobacteria bacterium]|nr:glycine cleavage system aminomethyltransferase GcvT [Deltaproteobacteria bacterium]
MRTPLFNTHVRLNAKMVDFHGWDMPVWYTGIKVEHLATRNACGLFDTSHMGEIYVSSGESVSFLNRMLTIDIHSMKQGQVKYTFLLNSGGGIIDDLTVYCIRPGYTYMLCVNASNKDKDFKWLTSHNKGSTILEDKSPNTSMLALQGPNWASLIKECLDLNLEDLKRFKFMVHSTPSFGDLLISRTGYTGADGVEIFMNNENAEALWNKFVEKGATPCGLGSRDTLRLEMGYPLHGNDIDEHITPFEAGLRFAVDLNKDFFIGKDALVKQKATGMKKRLTGLELMEKGVPRQGHLCLKEDKEVGIITSGSISPVLNKGIALCYLDSSIKEGEHIDILVRNKRLKAIVKRPPFVKGQIHN